MAYDMYLQIQGVDGESTRKGYEKWIEVGSFSVSASNPTQVGTASAGAGAGKVSISSFNVTKVVEASSPKLFAACCAGSHWDKGSLVMMEAGGADAVVFFQYDFTMLFVDSISWSGGSGGDSKPNEAVSFVFGSINTTYSAQTAQGGMQKVGGAGWSLTTNSKL